MASPKLISSNRDGLSVELIINSLLLSIEGALKCISNSEMHDIRYYKFILRAIAMSVFLQILFWLAQYACDSLSFVINYFLSTNIHIDLEKFKTVLNLNFICISADRFIDSTLDEIFLVSLKNLDLYSDSSFYNNMIELAGPLDDLSVSRLAFAGLHYQNKDNFLSFLKSSARLALFNLAFYMLLRYLYWLGFLLYAVFVFQGVGEILDILLIIVFIIGSLSLNPYQLVIVHNYIVGSKRLVKDVLDPFFIRLRFSSLERAQWVRSRDSILSVFGVFYFFLITSFPLVGLIIYAISHSSMAYLVTKLGSCPPKNSRELMSWIPSQLVWNSSKLA